MGKMIKTRKADGGVTVLVIDMEGDKVNKLTSELGEQLAPLLEQLAADTSCAGLVLMSGKPDNFIAGADIDQLAAIKTEAQGAALSRTGQQMLNSLEQSPVPIVAAINGGCMGGGLELAMACHGRVCTDHDKTVFALPEIMLGLIPGAGGTQRLPRLVGAQAALDMILTGKNIRPKKAKKMGLVDEVVSPMALERAAVARVLELVVARKRDQDKAWIQRELDDLREADKTNLLLAHNPLGRMVMFKKAGEMVEKKTRGHYPAPFAALRSVRKGLEKGMTRGLEVEAEEFGKLVISAVSNRLVEMYYAIQSIKKDTGVEDPEVQPEKVERLHVLGGGLMGSGIAYVSANKGVHVRIKERDHDAAAAAMGAVWDIVGPKVRRRFLRKPEAEVLMSRVTASPELSGISRSDMVIEAVFEDLELKQRLLKEVEAVTRDDCIFASNTSSIPITHIAAAAARPEMVLGMHFFSPVHKMPLLEIIVHDGTADQATATAVKFGKRLGKQVIVVRDGVGFYTSRILAPYLNEAAHVVFEGAAIDAVDRALVDWGFPVGPITLMDEVGLDVGEKVGHIMVEAFGERMAGPGDMAAITGDGRLGRKNQRGFYLYPSGKKKKANKQVDETIYDLLPGGHHRKPIDVPQVQLRIGLTMVNEALHCLGEGILRCARDGNIGAIFGLGFPPFLGGPLRYVDTRGAGQVLDDMKRLRDRHGVRFEPAPALVEAAKDKRQFCG